jgi:hypothetical protein
VYVKHANPVSEKTGLDIWLGHHPTQSRVKIRFYTKNQLPRFSGSSLKVFSFFFDGTPILFFHISSSWVK